MLKKRIKIKFQNGINYRIAINEVLNIVSDKFDFEESEQPDFVFFSAYGNDIPAPGPYVRIGYYCENIIPDLNACEWAFGIPSEQEINNPKYKRIQWHNLDPQDLVKKNINAEAILASKTRFCNFLYSHRVPYREEFFRQLSKYKKVDAPGKSMNNMPSIDSVPTDDKWGTKHQFLSQYKFTIAFENYVYPGYQTEKLYDAMLCQSIPVYCGDPNVGQIFNTKSFLNASDYIKANNSRVVKFLEGKSQFNFTDTRPMFFKSPKDRVQRKLKSIGKDLKMKLQFNKLDFGPLIDQIIALDKDPDKYMAMLQQPWFNNNQVPANTSLRERWIEIFTENNL
ncbi:MAG: glycosyltransferase family 10 [Bacteroidota bacterium]